MGLRKRVAVTNEELTKAVSPEVEEVVEVEEVEEMIEEEDTTEEVIEEEETEEVVEEEDATEEVEEVKPAKKKVVSKKPVAKKAVAKKEVVKEVKKTPVKKEATKKPVAKKEVVKENPVKEFYPDPVVKELTLEDFMAENKETLTKKDLIDILYTEVRSNIKSINKREAAAVVDTMFNIIETVSTAGIQASIGSKKFKKLNRKARIFTGGHLEILGTDDTLSMPYRELTLSYIVGEKENIKGTKQEDGTFVDKEGNVYDLKEINA